MLVKLVVIVCSFFQILFCQRKILNPAVPTDDKPYMVYMVMAPQSEAKYLGWLCGGVIVHPYYVLTAASCIYNVQYAYVISGYRKYIRAEDIELDNCTRTVKKRIIHVCSHRKYRWHVSPNIWPNVDLGFARVDSPFDYRDKVYLEHCSYQPKAIPMSFLTVRPGDDAIVLGWGHKRYFRPKTDLEDHNMQTLQYSTVRIVNISACKSAFNAHSESLLEFYGICAESSDLIDSEGNRVMPTEFKYGCLNRLKLNGIQQQNQQDPLLTEEHRCNESGQYFYDSRKIFSDESYPKEMMNTRRGGICQNDHGGPLVMWRGGREVVIGVANMFLVTQEMKCVGPFAFISLHSVNTFIYCLLPDLVKLGKKVTLKKRAYCNKTIERREMIERDISWANFENSNGEEN